jgi:hypothetical protein
MCKVRVLACNLAKTEEKIWQPFLLLSFGGGISYKDFEKRKLFILDSILNVLSRNKKIYYLE